MKTKPVEIKEKTIYLCACPDCDGSCKRDGVCHCKPEKPESKVSDFRVYLPHTSDFCIPKKELAEIIKSATWKEEPGTDNINIFTDGYEQALDDLLDKLKL